VAKTPLISLIKPIEATKVHPRTGLPLGLPEITVPYGALIERVGADRDRDKFRYLSEFYTCKHEAFVSATGGAEGPPEDVDAELPPAAVGLAEKASEPAPAREARLEWGQVNSSDYAVWRAAVPGGWLVALNGSSVTFVPDSRHQWDGGSPG